MAPTSWRPLEQARGTSRVSPSCASYFPPPSQPSGSRGTRRPFQRCELPARPRSCTAPCLERLYIQVRATDEESWCVFTDPQLWLLFWLTFVINLVGSLAYSVRIAGVRTLRIAVSLS